MTDERYRFIQLDDPSDEEVIVINAEQLASEPTAKEHEPEQPLRSEPTYAAEPDSDPADVRDATAEAPATDEGPASIEEAVLADDSFRAADPDAAEDPEAAREDEPVPFVNMQRAILVFLALLVIVFALYFVFGR
jgi:hypothetical protein